MSEADPFTYDGGRVDPGETQNVRYTISETYMGDPVRMPVTIVNGDRPGPTMFLSAAAHGDELATASRFVRGVAHEWDHAGLEGTLVCLPVLNVPGFIAQQRYFHAHLRPGPEPVVPRPRVLDERQTDGLPHLQQLRPSPVTSAWTSTPPRAAGRTCSTSARTWTTPRSRAWPTRSPPTSSSPPRGRRAPCAGKRRTRAFRPSPSRWGGPPVPARPHRPRARGRPLGHRRVRAQPGRVGPLARLADGRRRPGREDVDPRRRRWARRDAPRARRVRPGG